MGKSKPPDMPDREKRKHNKVNARRNAPDGKARGERGWIKARHRVRRKLLGR